MEKTKKIIITQQQKIEILDSFIIQLIEETKKEVTNLMIRYNLGILQNDLEQKLKEIKASNLVHDRMCFYIKTKSYAGMVELW